MSKIVVRALTNQYKGCFVGRPSGRFLLRCRIKKPREYQVEDKDSLFYLSPDFYVGAIVKLNDHVFLLTEADDYVFAFMERDDERERYGSFDKLIIFDLACKLQGYIGVSLTSC